MSCVTPFSRSQWIDHKGVAHVLLTVQGMRCGSCARSIERCLLQLPGVSRAIVNVATARLSVDWDAQATSLSSIVSAVTQAGFTPVPLEGISDSVAQKREFHAALKRLGVAGLGMMQTMMFVYGLNAGAVHSIDPAIAHYLRIAGMLFSVPVMFYSGWPILEGACRALRRRTLSMDVPIGAALLLAFTASVVNTLRGAGEIYYDSVTMFIFFLLAGRFIEMRVRHGSLNASEALARSLPATALRVTAQGPPERVPIEALEAGDTLLVPRGAMIAADGQLLSAAALVDESLISGESEPVRKHVGEQLLGGALNLGDPLRVQASGSASESTLTSIVRLLERAQADKPALARLADRVASKFVLITLLLAAATALVWWHIDPSRAFTATLAVLVVTCPCALALATPVAIAAATKSLARSGLMVSRADALERLARIDVVVLDKTGTLTCASPIARVTTCSGLTSQDAMAHAAALERATDHPVAMAFARYDSPQLIVRELSEFAGQGVQGCIGSETWRLGRTGFVAGLRHRAMPGEEATAPEGSAAATAEEKGFDVCLGSTAGQYARFEIHDPVRPDAQRAVEQLQHMGLECVVVSGDRQEAVIAAADMLKVSRWLARASPESKLAFVRNEQCAGHRILMVGDGINDAPVLGAANVSCAMGRGSAIAHSAADLLMLSESLQALAVGVSTARSTLRVIRQNLAWALCYNLACVPLAAMGRIPPWLAALGMSASSLLVVLNAARLAWRPAMKPAAADGAALPIPQPIPSGREATA